MSPPSNHPSRYYSPYPYPLRQHNHMANTGKMASREKPNKDRGRHMNSSSKPQNPPFEHVGQAFLSQLDNFQAQAPGVHQAAKQTPRAEPVVNRGRNHGSGTGAISTQKLQTVNSYMDQQLPEWRVRTQQQPFRPQGLPNSPAPAPRFTSWGPSHTLIAPPIHYRPEQAMRPFAGLPQSFQKRSVSPRSRGVPKLPVPKPTEAYLEQVNKGWKKLSAPQKLLIIIDLNGTLVHRPGKGGSRVICRPRVPQFLEYLFQEHCVMVWSSAWPENVKGMVNNIFSPEGVKRLVAVWGRDTLGLTTAQYNAKVQEYKQLQWVWGDQDIQLSHFLPQHNVSTLQHRGGWDQSNTFLVDDSIIKACSHPHNIIEIDEFTNAPGQMSSDILAQVVGYIEEARYASDVSAYARHRPFRVNTRWQWIWPEEPDRLDMRDLKVALDTTLSEPDERVETEGAEIKGEGKHKGRKKREQNKYREEQMEPQASAD